MKKEIDFVYQKLEGVFFDGTIKDKINENKEYLYIAASIAKVYLNSPYLYLTECNKEENGSLSLKFKGQNHKLVEIKINDKNIFIKTDDIDVAYTYELRDKIECRLIYNVTKDKEKTLIEEENNHRLKMSIYIGNKVFEIDIDLDFTHYFGMPFFKSLTEESTIFDLRKFYLENFFPMQTAFSKKEPTYLREITDDKGRKVKSTLTLSEGFIRNYSISKFKEGVIVTATGEDIKNPTYEVSNYNREVKINEIIDELDAKISDLSGIIRH